MELQMKPHICCFIEAVGLSSTEVKTGGSLRLLIFPVLFIFGLDNMLIGMAITMYVCMI